MKHKIILLLVLAAALCAQAQPKLKIYLVSHNEDNIGYLNGSMGYNKYKNARNAMINICDLAQVKNMKYNYGGEHVALRAIAQYDTGTLCAAGWFNRQFFSVR